jgi:hypothetical protein
VTQSHGSARPGLFSGIHVLHAWDVASTAARDGLPLSPEDVGKLCKVGGTFYLLAGVSPAVWTTVGGGGAAGAGDRVVLERTADVAVGGGRAVVANGATGCVPALASNAGHLQLFLGVTQAAASAGATVDVVALGQVSDSSWSFTPGLPVFVSPTVAGVLTQTVPAAPSSAFSLSIGVAVSPTELFVRPLLPLLLL